MWWSFYETEASFDRFLERALPYASDGEVQSRDLPSTYDRQDRLRELLSRRRFLLVLDGVERELRAYGSLRAAYQGDDVKEDARGDFRSCVDPSLARFLERLATGYPKSRTLLTSRLMPRELDALAGVRRTDLPRMDPEDAYRFFVAQGVKGTRAEVAEACRPYDNLPLCLRVLSATLAKDARYRGDIKYAKEIPVLKLEGVREEDRDSRKLAHILQFAWTRLKGQDRSLLSRIAAFRSPVEFGAVEAIAPRGAKRYLADRLTGLADRDLLLYERGGGTYDLHPAVRRFAYAALRNKAGLHRDAAVHLRQEADLLGPQEVEDINSVDDLRPVIELYHHLVGAGRCDEAWELLRDRLGDPLYYRLGAYEMYIELLRGLFPDGEDKPPRLRDEQARGWTLNALAGSYYCSGENGRAVPLLQRSNAIDERRGDTRNLCVGLGNVAAAQVLLGQLDRAQRNLQRARDVSAAAREQLREAVEHQELGHVSALRGDWGQAREEWGKAERVFKARGEEQAEGIVRACRAQAGLVGGEAKEALQAAREARRLADVAKVERDIVRAEWLLGWANQAFGNAAEAEGHLDEAILRCRRINLVELEPDILLATARLGRDQGRREEARKRAEEGLRIADRCEYRLKQADIHNFLAQLALDEGDLDLAEREAKIGKERADCGYVPAQQESRRLLEEIKQRRPA